MRRGLLLATLAAVLFGLTVPASAPLLDSAGPVVLAGLLYLGAALGVVVPALRSRESWRMSRGTVLRLAVAVLSGGLVAPVLVLVALAGSDAAEVSLLLNLELAATVVLAVVAFGDHLPARGWIGAGLIVAAGALLAGGDVGSVGTVALVAAACLLWALDSNISATLADVPPTRIVLVKGAVAGTANVVIGASLGQPVPIGTPLAAALVVGALGYGISLVAWIAAARRLGAARTMAVFATAPFIGAATAWAVAGGFTPLQGGAALLAGIGATLVVLAGAHAHSHAHGAVVHDHPHVPDTEHRHTHGPAGRRAREADPG